MVDSEFSDANVVLPNNSVGGSRRRVGGRCGTVVKCRDTMVGGVIVINGGGRGGFDGPSMNIFGGGGIFV